jgi:hypothetical protein
MNPLTGGDRVLILELLWLQIIRKEEHIKAHRESTSSKVGK